MASLNHPNIITIYDVGTEGGRPFIAMELVRGVTLAEHLRQGPLPETSIVEPTSHCYFPDPFVRVLI